MAGRARFTKDSFRFVVTENNVRVYKREYENGGETESSITPQYAGTLKKKYSTEINKARKSLNG
jgi:hypothetical protein